MSIQKEVQDEQSQSGPASDTGLETAERQSNPFEGLSRDELLDEVQRYQKRVHEVNEESKSRKIKLRELETLRETEQNSLLEEQNRFRELYEGLKESTKDYNDLKSFRESIYEREQARLSDQTKKLSIEERKELELMEDLPLEKKLKWVELRLNNRQTINLDTSSSVRQGGSFDKMPQNRSELTNLNIDERLKFKEKYPQAYNEAMKKK